MITRSLGIIYTVVDTKDITLYSWSYHTGVSSLGPTAPALAGAVYSHHPDPGIQSKPVLVEEAYHLDIKLQLFEMRSKSRLARIHVTAQKTSRHLFRNPITAKGVRAKAAAVIKNSGPGPAASYMGAAA